MSDSSANTAMISQYFEHFNSYEWHKVAEMYVEVAEFKDPAFGPGIVQQSKDETVQKYKDMQALYPDLHSEIVHIYPAGTHHVIVELVSTGTASDGSRFELPVCTIFTVENGQIIKDFTYYDNFGG